MDVITSALGEMDAFGWVIIVGLVILSIACWAITFQRWTLFQRARRQSAAEGETLIAVVVRDGQPLVGKDDRGFRSCAPERRALAQ